MSPATATDTFKTDEILGCIPLLIDRTMGWLGLEASMLVDKRRDFRSGEQNRWRYSDEALREFVVNALVHRDYQHPRSTRVEIFRDRIEFENPGGLVNGESLESLKRGHTSWRNPSLANFLVALGYAQQQGTGLPKAIAATLRVAGAEPEIEVSAFFRVIVPAYDPSPAAVAEEPVTPGSGVVIISIGNGAIDLDLIRRSSAGLRALAQDRVCVFRRGSAA